jgi:branched-chain amino acid transport system substrate-binding protein
MRKRLTGLIALAAAASTTLAACSSSGGTGGGGGGGTIKIGVISDYTGVASSSFASNDNGVNAYIKRVNTAGGINGHKIEFVRGDTASSPTGALTAAQKLVQVDKVFAIVENSSYFYGAEPFLLKENIPVVGSGIDGPIWSDPKNTNLFTATGVSNSDYSQEAFGKFAKQVGVTKCGSIAYAGSASAAHAAMGYVQSCERAGLKAGYLNTELPFGTTDVGAIALAIKDSGIDGIYLPLVPSTSFALLGALKQLGVKLKSALLPTGYGGDLLANKAGVQAAQGYDFQVVGAPAEAETAATKQRAADLAAVGVTTPPTFAEQESYLSTVAFGAGLKAAGDKPTRESFLAAMNDLKGYDGEGLMAPQKISFHEYVPKELCTWFVRLEGETFKIHDGMPICGPLFKLKT